MQFARMGDNVLYVFSGNNIFLLSYRARKNIFLNTCRKINRC